MGRYSSTVELGLVDEGSSLLLLLSIIDISVISTSIIGGLFQRVSALSPCCLMIGSFEQTWNLLNCLACDRFFTKTLIVFRLTFFKKNQPLPELHQSHQHMVSQQWLNCMNCLFSSELTLLWFFKKIIYLFLATLDLHCCVRSFSSGASGGYSCNAWASHCGGFSC